MPDPKTMALSVFRRFGLLPKKLWTLGDRRITRDFYGVGTIKASHAMKEGLDVRPDKRPYRLANIVGWPSEKAKRKSIAQELAANASLELKSK